MLKLIGSVMVFGSCAALGLSARQNLRRRVAAANAMLLALGLIRSEISGRRTPMPEIVGLLTENEQLLSRSGREEQALMTTLAGLIVVLMLIVQEIDRLFTMMKNVFGF